DNRDLGLAGGDAAAPIWADFMKAATALPTYREVQDFTMPEGIQSVLIDPESLQLATPNCPTTRSEVYVAGSGPTTFCELHGGHGGVLSSTGSFLSHIFGGGGDPKNPQNAQPGADGQPAAKYDANRPPGATGQGQAPDASAKPDEKKKNPL